MKPCPNCGSTDIENYDEFTCCRGNEDCTFHCLREHWDTLPRRPVWHTNPPAWGVVVLSEIDGRLSIGFLCDEEWQHGSRWAKLAEVRAALGMEG